MTTEPLPLTLAETAEFLTRYEAKDLLRFVTCGSVDDGKSTLIGRLLLETGSIYDDQFASLRTDSAKHGTTDLEIDPALLLDGLEDERQQGITIDVAYRYFQTPKRKFIIADSPGHEQYTRNMATAASTAQAAIILMDARKGMLAQTRRHSFIASLLGVRTLILAVNKMDLVEYSQAVFGRLSEEFRSFVAQLNVEESFCLPLSGLRGDNVTRPSEQLAWFNGPTLLSLLENLPVDHGNDAKEFRFPVQRVSRPDAEFRGFSGTVVAGQVQVGDLVTVLPSGRRTRVQSIVTFDGKPSYAYSGAPVTLTLEDEIDIARGDLITHVGHAAKVEKHFFATIVWMSAQPLVPGKAYWLKHTTRQTTAEVEYVSHRIDVNTLNRMETTALQLNEIGHCRIAAHTPLAFDSYRRNRRTGSFILVDRITDETVAAGTIFDLEDYAPSGSHWNVELRSSRLQFTPSRVTAAQRRERFGHGAFTILLTGLSGSGKTTLAFELEKYLFATCHAVTVLDGQNLRHGISRDLGFSAPERAENLRRAAEISRVINDAGMICIAAFVAPDASIREKARQVIGAERFLHVHLSAALEICRQRDTSGRYQAADRGEIASFPGVTAPYEVPFDANLVVPTDELDIEESLERIKALVNASPRKVT
jgi:bifunctional enzyme CysN/CysC